MLIAILYPHGGIQLAQADEETVAYRAKLDTLLNFFFLSTNIDEPVRQGRLVHSDHCAAAEWEGRECTCIPAWSVMT